MHFLSLLLIPYCKVSFAFSLYVTSIFFEKHHSNTTQNILTRKPSKNFWLYKISSNQWWVYYILRCMHVCISDSESDEKYKNMYMKIHSRKIVTSLSTIMDNSNVSSCAKVTFVGIGGTPKRRSAFTMFLRGSWRHAAPELLKEISLAAGL